MVDTTLIDELKGSIDAEQAKKEKKKVYMREYMRKKRAEDTEFYEKQKAYNRVRKNIRYATDAEFREKQKTNCRERAKENANFKQKYEELLGSTQNV